MAQQQASAATWDLETWQTGGWGRRTRRRLPELSVTLSLCDDIHCVFYVGL
jgi:hypothetical protein